MSASKRCPKCRTDLPETAFYLHRQRGVLKRSCWCIECQRARSKKSYAARAGLPETKRAARAATIKAAYGVTLDYLEGLRLLQNGECAICSAALRGGNYEHIDHCHASGRVRGILCSECNTGIGKLKDDPALLLRAVAYLTAGEPECPATKTRRSLWPAI